jgi:hypothetical protein
VLCHLGQGDAVAVGEGVTDRHHQDAVLVEQHRRGHVVVVARQVEHGEVELPVDELRAQRRRGRLDHHHAHAGVHGSHGLEQPGDEPARRRPDHPDAGAAGHLGAEGRDVGRERVEFGLDPAAPLDHDLALLGEAAGGPVDQEDAQLALEAGDVGRHVGLHRVQRLGRSRERPVVRHGDEGGELTQIHLHQ